MSQNLYARPRPNWKEQVGIDVQRGDRARVMKDCFRNTREIVELAFNVLIGSQARQELKVQTRTYADVDYLKKLNLLEELGDHFRVRFADRTHEKPRVHKFSSRQDEKRWLASEIDRLIQQESVRPEDILILFNRSTEFEDLSSIIEERNNHAIKGFVKPYGDNSDKDHYIFRQDHLTISTTHGAKGYDAQIVFLVGVDLFDPAKREDRASFYVGATRSKMVLYLSGMERIGNLIYEAEAISKVL